MASTVPQDIFSATFAQNSSRAAEYLERGFAAGGGRRYTYVVVGDCDDGGKGKLVYKLRDDHGTFKEKWCDSERAGKLAYIGDTSFDFGGGDVVTGWVYNGKDADELTIGYFFSQTPSTTYNSHFVLLGDPVSSAGQFSPWAGFLCQRK